MLQTPTLQRCDPHEVDLDADRLARIETTFAADVAAGRIPGAIVLVSRGGKLAYQSVTGFRDRGTGEPLAADALFRGASMTKPLVAVAAMMLVESGTLQLADPVAAYLPAFAAVRVGEDRREPTRPMTVQDLFRHTSGLTYGPFGTTPVHQAYNAAGMLRPDQTNAEMAARLATLPLLVDPGSTFEYGMSIDLLGAIVEVVSGLDLATFLVRRITGPLGMVDTGFTLEPSARGRLAEGHEGAANGERLRGLYDPAQPAPRWFSGGGGILTTGDDYARFAAMLLAGGTFEGTRYLGRKTVAHMTTDHLPPGVRYGSFVPMLGISAPLPEFGQGFGLGMLVRTARGGNPSAGSIGDYGWGGISGTYFWNDPQEALSVVFMVASPEHRVHFRPLLRDLVYAALN